MMIGYVTIGVKDISKAKEFYCNLFNAKVQLDGGRIVMIGKTKEEPMVAVCTPFNEGVASCGNGTMIAFPVKTKEAVGEMHAKAISLGAIDDGAPGQRVEGVFYGAYVKDLDGNKLAFYIFG